MKRLLLIAVVGCTESPDSLADLGTLDLSFYYGLNFLEVEINFESEPRECPTLGDDFHAFVAREPAKTWPGGWIEDCVNLGNGRPCTPERRCTLPLFSILTYGLPADDPVVVFGDDSLVIECKLGDELVPRQATLVSPDSWSNFAAGERITVQWSPATDLARFPVRIELDEEGNPFRRTELESVVDGGLISFEVPSTLSPGRHYLSIYVAADLPATTQRCGGISNERSLGYYRGQYFIVVQPQ